MIAIKSALIYSDGYCLGQLNQMALGPYFQATRYAIPPNCPVDVDSSVFLFHAVDAFAPAEPGRQRRVRRDQDATRVIAARILDLMSLSFAKQRDRATFSKN
jgi:hypothetical protein